MVRGSALISRIFHFDKVDNNNPKQILLNRVRKLVIANPITSMVEDENREL